MFLHLLSLAANLLLLHFWAAAVSRSLSLCLCVLSESGLLGYDFVSLWLRVSAPRLGPDFNWPPLPIISLESASVL